MDDFPKKDFSPTSTAGTSESDSFRFRYASVVPEPGTVCPLCREKTPNEKALRMRAWREKRKSKTLGTGEKLND